MKRLFIVLSTLLVLVCTASFYEHVPEKTSYVENYRLKLSELKTSQRKLLSIIKSGDLSDPIRINQIKEQIRSCRLKLKAADFWLRYLEPISYKKINGPLPIEWETEVFEKFEQPYKREGAGLTLAELYLEEKVVIKGELIRLIELSDQATEVFLADSITRNLNSYHHFFLCNRLLLLNLAAIYTTGFECPDSDNIIPELAHLFLNVADIYSIYNQTFPERPLSDEYLNLFTKAGDFVNSQGNNADQFNHFDFIKKYINPLFTLNQQMIRSYKVKSISYNDYSLSNESTSIFDKSLFKAQDTKGVYYAIKDEQTLNDIKETGKLLFYDPILSSNSKRSCVSCHKPEQYFTDTVLTTALSFNKTQSLSRNTPSVINIVYNHLVNLDGKHFNLQDQAKAVIASQDEMGASGIELLDKILSCDSYKSAFKRYSGLTPYSKVVSLDHVVSAITFYLSEFSESYSPFDGAINDNKVISKEAIQGFNLFMGKAQCGTCHFVPQFNGVKPPYVGSEFEVLGVPQDKAFGQLSADKGRYGFNPSRETLNAFRTGTVRNSPFTAPYMHNGIFRTLREVMDFYNAGGGAGRSLQVPNQTLSRDSLKLTETEIEAIIQFIESLNEKIEFPEPPAKLPESDIKALNARKVGGEY